MLWLALVLPELPLQVFMRAAAADVCLAVVSPAPQARILTASTAARDAGVHNGQRVAAALAAVPELQLQPRAIEREHGTLIELACLGGRFTPRIHIALPDSLLLEISSSLRLFGGAASIEAEMLATAAELGLQVRTACAPAALAAQWFARCGRAPDDGQDWRAALDELPITVLTHDDECTPATLELLTGLGIATVGEARALPAAGLARRQAHSLHAVLARARGETADPRNWFQLPVRFSHGLILPAAATVSETLLFASRRLLASLAAWLQTQHAAIDQFQLVLEHEQHADTTLEIVLGTPSCELARFTVLAHERLSAHTLSAPVHAMRIESGALVDLLPASGDLFGGGDSAAAAAAELLRDRLCARLGAAAVCGLHTRADHRPEAASIALARTPGAGQHARAALDIRTATRRPFWLLPTPQAVHGADLRLRSEPERIESGWWDGSTLRRDYYLAEHGDGVLCWVYQELGDGTRWYVHGYFA